MPKRLLITFEAPMAVRSGFAQSASPDGALVSVDSLPVSPAILPMQAAQQPAVGKMMMPKFCHQAFQSEQLLSDYLTNNSLLLEGFYCLMNNKEIPNEIAVAFFQMDERIAAQQASKVTFQEALKLLFTPYLKTTHAVVNACYGVDLRTPLHRNFNQMVLFQKYCANKHDIYKQFNYAAPDYLFSCNQFLQNLDCLEFRQNLLQTIIKDNLLNERVARFYSLKEIANCNVSLEDILQQQDLPTIMKALKNKIKSDNTIKIRITNNQEQRYQINQQIIPEEIKQNQIIVLAVSTQDNDKETLLQDPCNVEEFQTYSFEELDEGDYFLHCVFNLKPIKNVLIQTLEQQSGLKKSRRANAIASDQNSGSEEDFQQNETKNKAKKQYGRKKTVKQEAQDLQELILAQSQIPEVFYNNLDNYLQYYKQYNNIQYYKHQLAISTHIIEQNESLNQAQIHHWYQQSTCKQFWFQTKDLIIQLLNYQEVFKKANFGGKLIKEIFVAFMAKFNEQLQVEIADLGEKQRIHILFESPATLHLAQGHYARILQYNVLSRSLVDFYYSQELDVKQYIESIIFLIRGVNQLMYHRIGIEAQQSYVKYPDDFLVPTIYCAWGFTQLYGVGLLQVFKQLQNNEQEFIIPQSTENNKKFNMQNSHQKEQLAQEEQYYGEEYEELEENPPNNLLPHLQFSMRYSIQNLNEPKSQINKQSIAYSVVKNQKLLEQNQAKLIDPVNQNDPNQVEDLHEPGDYIYGLAFYPPDLQISSTTNTYSNCKQDIFSSEHNWTQKEAAVIYYDPDIVQNELINNIQISVQQMIDTNSTNLNDQCIDNLISLSYQPSTCPVRLVQTSANSVFVAPTPNSDQQTVQNYQQLIDKLKEFGYETDQLQEVQSSSQQLTQTSENLQSSKNDIFTIQMLDSNNNDKLQYISAEFEVNIPKVIMKKKVKTIAEFIDQWGVQQLQNYGFDIPNLTLFADMQRFNQYYNPGIIYSKKLNKYMYLPLILGEVKQITSSKQFSIDLYNQAVFLQNLVIQHYSWPVKTIEANILTLLDSNAINKKLATQLRESVEKGYSCNTYIGIVAQQLLDAYKYEQKLHDLLGLEENEHKIIELNDIESLQQSQPIQQQQNLINSSVQQFLEDQESDLQIYQFVIDNYDYLSQQFDNDLQLQISQDQYKYIQKQHSNLSLVNSNKDFILTKKQLFNNYDTNQSKILYIQYINAAQIENSTENQNITLQLKNYLNSQQITHNLFDFILKEALNAKNFVYLGRIRGLQIAQQLLQQKLSPDDEIVQSQKNYGFCSVKVSELTYQTLIQILNELTLETPKQKISANDKQQLINKFNFFYNLFQQNDFSLFKQHQKITVPHNIDLLNPLQQFQQKTKILMPLFKQYGILQETGQLPLLDIYGRVLRQKAPYQQILQNTIQNEPAPLEIEAPPPPAASGEESTMQHLIDFWENVKNKFFCIPDERIRALLSPLYSLEEREIEFIEVNSECRQEILLQDKQDNIQCENIGASCRCGDVTAIMYPNPNPGSLTLEQFQKGIYYMSPFYIPPSSDYEIERMRYFRLLVKAVVSSISQLLKQNLQQMLNCAQNIFEKENKFIEVITATFLKFWPQEYYADHIRQEVTDQRYQQFKSTGQQNFSALIQQNDFYQFKDINCKLTTKIKQFAKSLENQLNLQDKVNKLLEQYQTELTFEQQVNDLQDCIIFIVKKNPILNLMTYSDPDDLQVIQPMDVCQYIISNKIGENLENDFNQLKSYLDQCKTRGRNDEILQELVKKQQELKIIERENIKQNVQLHHRLQQCKYQDIQNETAELFCTAVNAAWGRICAQDRAAGNQKIGSDQLALGGFETNGPRGDYSASAELDSMAQRNCLGFGTWTWEKDTFDIKDIVDFDEIV